MTRTDSGTKLAVKPRNMRHIAVARQPAEGQGADGVSELVRTASPAVVEALQDAMAELAAAKADDASAAAAGCTAAAAAAAAPAAAADGESFVRVH